MLKILKKIKFAHSENRMKKEGDVKNSIEQFDKKNTNLDFLLTERFHWMNNYIQDSDIGIEVGCAAGFSKLYIKNKNFKISDFSDDDHLDYKNIDAQETGFKDRSFDYVIASNMIHHLPFPLKFFKEMNRILKKDGRLIIFDAHCSVLLQLILILMKHEGYDFTKDIWNKEVSTTHVDDLWAGNSAIPYLIFNNKKKFNEQLGSLFEIKYDKLCECLLFLNSGGVTSKTFYIPLNYFFLNILDKIDYIFTKSFPKIFAMNRCLVLKKM